MSEIRKYPWLKRIRNKEIRNGFKWCDRCLADGKKTLAVYKGYGSKACEEHAQGLNDSLAEDFTEFSDADDMTWHK